MATSRKTSAPKKASADTAAAVDALMASLKHPHKAAIGALRRVICGAHPSIAEGVKWNAPSFRTGEYFATTHLRAKQGVGVILHLGAKVRAGAKVDIEDPDKMLTWLAKDRAMIVFKDGNDLAARRSGFQSIIRRWIAYV